jgi:hypothetical protein
MPELEHEERIHVYKFLQLALVDYVNCRKYGDNYKEEDMDQEMVIEVHNPYEVVATKKGHFPNRGGSLNKKKSAKFRLKDKGLLKTSLKSRNSRSPNIPRRNGAKVKNNHISDNGQKVKLKKKIYAPERDEVTPQRRRSRARGSIGRTLSPNRGDRQWNNEQRTQNNRKYSRGNNDPPTVPHSPVYRNHQRSQSPGVYQTRDRHAPLAKENNQNHVNSGSYGSPMPSNISV